MATCTGYPYDFTELTTTSQKVEETYNLLTTNFTAKRYFIGPWADRHRFVQEHLITPATIANFARPATYPDVKQAFVTEVRIRGEGVATVNAVTNMASYVYAIIEVNYETAPYNLAHNGEQFTDESIFVNNIFLEESGDIQGEGLVIDGVDLQVQATGQNLDEKGFFNAIVITGGITLTAHYILNPYWQFYDSLIGHVNNNAFITPAGRAFRAGTLRYDGVGPISTKVNVDTLAGENFPFPAWSITHNFSFNKHGWNHKFIDGQWQKVVAVAADGGLDDIHILSEFYDLFTGGKALTLFQETLRTAINTELNNIYTSLQANGSLSDPANVTSLANIRRDIQALGFRIP